MAPSTRRINRETTPDRPIPYKEFDTVQKTRFFREWDERDQSQSQRVFYATQTVSRTTGQRWLQERDALGDIAYRRTRKQSEILGRPEIIAPDQYRILVSPSKNPVRDQQYDVQMNHHNIHASVRTLRRGLRKYTKDAKRYKMAYVAKKLPTATRTLRLQYARKYQYKTVHDFWRYIIYTDEAHIDPSSQRVGNILREAGTRLDIENIQERPPKEGVKLHIAAWVTWDHKAPELIFYNDEEEYVLQPTLKGRPRKSIYEEKEAYDQRVIEWTARQPHKQVIIPKGNAMTQKYYTETVLPKYVDAMHSLRLNASSFPEPYILQEDNDPSHGTRKPGLAQQYRDGNWIPTIKHPAQSPDLSPIEGIWAILKQRARRRPYKDLEDYKRILQEEWAVITQAEVQARIRELPARLELIIRSKGKPVRTALW
jgi:hypothetical protein